jgi:sarcosine oxidase, subunit beta
VDAGAELVRDRVSGVRVEGNRVGGVSLASGAVLDCNALVIAAGPYLPNVTRMLGVELPVFHELHGKMTFDDTERIIPRDAPFTIWTDPMHLPFTDEERASFGSRPEMRRLLDGFPGGVHVRPAELATGREIQLIWTYDIERRDPVWPPVFEPSYGEALLRGVARMVPPMAAYFGRGHEGFVDGGYYCKTPENRPLVGPLAVEGAFVTGALSGYGLMAAHVAGELVASHVVGAELPDYARWFLPSRYDDAEYAARALAGGAGVGQL